MKPRAPASDTAAASSGVDGPPASGAPTTGISINDLNASVLMTPADPKERSPNLPRWLKPEVIPHRRLAGPLAVPVDLDGVAGSVCIARANLDRDLVCAGIENVLVARRRRVAVELSWRGFRPLSRDVDLISGGPVDVQEIDVALGAGMHGGHRQRR